ncbi:MAG: hypothetical protein H0U65_11020 [Rubrobacter sp.]|nr:hypothetical protein [Rubrobacter sp.]
MGRGGSHFGSAPEKHGSSVSEGDEHKAESLRLYLDNNVYNRPFDDRTIQRNRKEADSAWVLLRAVEAEEVELVSSFVVEVEHSRLADPARRERVEDIISFAREYVAPNEEILQRAVALGRVGFGVGWGTRSTLPPPSAPVWTSS